MTALFVPVLEPTLLGNQNLLNPIYILAFQISCAVCPTYSVPPTPMTKVVNYLYMSLIFRRLKATYYSK